MDKVLLLGSGALKIGEAGEFDFSGSQALKALQEEDVETVLVNPNVATVQTSKELADTIYFLPVTADYVEQVIEKERPDGIMLAFGGQTALNCGVELKERGVFQEYNVEVLGTAIESITLSEDREAFHELMDDIGVNTSAYASASTVTEAKEEARDIGYPVIIRSEYSLGGEGSGFAHNKEELEALASKALSSSPTIFIQESVKGWREVEYEVVRDVHDNCITVCNMENIDPLGIHTGESVVVAPSQTLTNEEYHYLRDVSLKVIRALEVVGECNIQLALNPDTMEYRVIEVNARLSRSSALASKATGYPLAFVAAKLALGKSLVELQNDVTKETTACFEPAMDYVAVKVPRWDFSKFQNVEGKIGSGMQSVGEVMALGRSFEEALQKGLRMVDTGQPGFACAETDVGDIEEELCNPSNKRIYVLREAFKKGYSVEDIHELTAIDKWFLYKMQHIVDLEEALEEPTPETLQEAKKAGFSDEQIHRCSGIDNVRATRKELGIEPVVKKIDTMAAEFPARSNYLYLTYHGEEDDLSFNEDTVVVLGSGAYRIGSSVEFDWACVSSLRRLQHHDYTTAVVNFNPETVSTDYDVSDKLYFDELSKERILDIYDKERWEGVVVSFGGQTPNSLALELQREGVPVLGTDPKDINNAESRYRFSSILDELGIDQPRWKECDSVDEAKRFAERVSYPVLVRPSYVLSGAAMNVAYDEEELEAYLRKAADLSDDHPVVVSEFFEDAKEVEVDAVANGGDVLAYAISEHVEQAGVHSGDSSMIFPPQKLYVETVRRVKKVMRAIADRFSITGPFNVQFLAKDNAIKVIECNLRTSRSFPFVSKVLHENFVELATDAIVSESPEAPDTSIFDIDYVGVKVPQFSFSRLAGADPVLGVEMSSTGEVACLGENPYEAFIKALESTGFKRPDKSVLVSLGTVEDKADFLEQARSLGQEYALYVTPETGKFFEKEGIECVSVSVDEATEMIRGQKVDVVITTPHPRADESEDGYELRRTCTDHNVSIITDIDAAQMFVESLEEDVLSKPWSDYR